MQKHHPDAFTFELRTLCDQAFETPPTSTNPIVALVDGKTTHEHLRTYWAARWDRVLLRNEYLAVRLMENCPDIHGRADIWRVIFPEWGKGRLDKTEPALFQKLLAALGHPVEADPALDRSKPEVAKEMARIDSMEWFELLGWCIAHEAVAPKVFPLIDQALSQRFGLSDEALTYFSARAMQDREHIEILLALAARFATTAEAQQAVRSSALAYFSSDPDLCAAVGVIEYSYAAKSHSLALGSGWRGKRRGAARAMNDGRFDCITFDCYGTLIDWEQGVGEAFAEAASHDAVKLDTVQAVAIFREVDAQLKRQGYRSYRELLTEASRLTAARLGWAIPRDQVEFLADSVGDWQPFSDTNPALRRLVERGFRLGILSNVDDDMFENTLRHLEAPFELVVTSEKVQSYKPAPAHFTAARKQTAGSRWLHVARGLHSDILPAHAQGIAVAWIHRGAEATSKAPEGCQSFSTLRELVDWLDARQVRDAA